MTEGEKPSAQELLDEARKIGHRRDRNTVILLVVLVVAIVALIVTLTLLTRSVNDSGSNSAQARDAVVARIRSDARADCRSEISGEYGKQRDLRDDLATDLQAQLASVLIESQAGARPGPEVVTRFINTKEALDNQRSVVKALPTFGHAIEKGYTVIVWPVGYLHHAACPTVPKVSSVGG